MRTSKRLTDKMIRENFDENLQAAIDTGQGPFTEQGFSFEVFKALMRVAETWPAIRSDRIREARETLEAQLSGALTRGQPQPPVDPEIAWPIPLA